MTGGEQGVTWKDGVIPVSVRFDDPYFSLADGLAETRHVFLDGNGLPARLCDGFHVAELGFGTGLNLLALVIAWAGTGRAGRLRYTSFEAYPLPATDIARALRHFPEAMAVAGPFLAAWDTTWDTTLDGGTRRFALSGIDVEVITGDARDTLPAWQGIADAWFLDGFSPAKNPELWSPDLMTAVAGHTVTGGTFATYTAAGHVRRSLEAAGFGVERVAGHGRKRHMTIGRK